MVHVRIHNGDAQGAAIGVRVMVADIFHHHRFVIDIAKATVAVHNAHGVVPRRPHKGKSLLAPFKHQLGSADGPARRGQVRIGAHRRSRGQAKVRSLKLGMGGKGWPVFGNAGDVEQPFFKQLVARVEQAFLPLWMRGRDCPVKGGKNTTPRLRAAASDGSGVSVITIA